MHRFAANAEAAGVLIRACLRTGRVIALAAPLGACASVASESLSFDDIGLSPVVTALAPSAEPRVDTYEARDGDQEVERLALTSSPPPASDDILTQPAIQGRPLVDEIPPKPGGEHVAYVDESDPFEGINRAVFHFNVSVDTWILEPAARTYRTLVPPPVRMSVRNAASNLESPVTFANDVLQGEWDRAHVTLARFVINSTIGVVGFHDPATEMGYEGHREDFDQTLALHGVPSGPYLVVPLLGPATPRHLVGRVVDSLAHPLTWILAGEPIETVIAERAAEGVVQREEVLDVVEQTKATSSDYYGAVRSFYRQNRISEISNGSLVANTGVMIDPSEDLEVDF